MASDEVPTLLPTATQLHALVVSDIHGAFAELRLLRPWLRAAGLSFDVVLCLGDLTSASMPAETQQADNEAKASAARALRLLIALGAPLVFVPGNHDPMVLYANASSSALGLAGATNAHGRSVALAPGLRLLGWGGSIPATEEGRTVWAGWPFVEADMASGLASLTQLAGSDGASDSDDSLATLPPRVSKVIG